MTALKVLVLLPAWFLLCGFTLVDNPSPSPSPAESASPAPSPSPVPTPTPVNAFISIDVTAGGANTAMTVST